MAPRGANRSLRSARPRDAGGSGRHPAQRVVGERARTRRARRTEGVNALEGSTPGRHRRTGPARDRWTERARRPDRGPEADRVRPLLEERANRRAQRQEGRVPREGGRRARGERLEGRSPGTLGGRKAPAGTAVDIAKEVSKPRTRYAAGPPSPAGHGSAVLVGVVGHASPGEEASSDARSPSGGPGRCGGAAIDL